MKNISALGAGLLVILITLLSSGCDSMPFGPTATPAPSLTFTPIPPTLTPTNTPRPPTLTPVPTVPGEEIPWSAIQGDNNAIIGVGGYWGIPPFTISTGSTHQAGFWRTIDGATVPVHLYDADDQLVAEVVISGVVRWDQDGNIFEGLECFQRIEFTDQPGEFHDITETERVDGGFLITLDNSSIYYIYEFYTDFVARIEQRQ